MSFYIVFDNLSSLLETSQSADLAKDIEKAVADSVDTARLDIAEVSQVTTLVMPDGKILLKVDNSSDDAALAIDYDKGAVALLSQVSAATAPEAEQTLPPKVEVEVSSRNENNENFYPIFEKLEISLRYRIDHADIFRSRQEIENSESAGKLAEKNLERENAEQNNQAERRFQEKQAENLRECLKQKRFATQFQEINTPDLLLPG